MVSTKIIKINKILWSLSYMPFKQLFQLSFYFKHELKDEKAFNSKESIVAHFEISLHVRVGTMETIIGTVVISVSHHVCLDTYFITIHF